MADDIAIAYSVRVMTINDLELVLEWRNHPDIRRFMYTQHEISLDEHTRWFCRASGDSRKHLLIFEADQVPQGFINISETNHGVADWGFYLAPTSPKGTGKKLGTAAIDYAFFRLGMHKLCGQAIVFNDRSIKFHQAMGFQQEGTLRDQYYDGAMYHSVVCFGLLSHEWRRINESSEHD